MSADEVAVLVEFLRRVVPRGPAEEELLVGLVEKLERVLPRAA